MEEALHWVPEPSPWEGWCDLLCLPEHSSAAQNPGCAGAASCPCVELEEGRVLGEPPWSPLAAAPAPGMERAGEEEPCTGAESALHSGEDHGTLAFVSAPE